jgi:hypothetical protein
MNYYHIVKISRGRTTVMAIGSLPKMRRRLKELRSGTAHGKTGGGKAVPVQYAIKGGAA